MRSGTIAFTLGVALCQLLAELPDPFYVAWLPLALLVAGLCPGPRRLALLGAGFLWAVLSAHHALVDRWPASLEGRDLGVTARVRGLPVPFAHGTRFEADVRAPGSARTRRVRLAWYGEPPALEPGQRWRLTVRLRRPHGSLNPHGFDYERWLFRRGIAAVGYVRDARGRAGSRAGTAPRLLATDPGGAGARLDRIRARVLERLARSLGHERFGPIVIALAVGERTRIPAADWQVLRRTGTAHLMAISGLHIGLAAALGFWLGRRIWAGLRLGAAGLAAAPSSALAAALAAGAYAAMAGFSLPTQRALVMVAVALAGVVLRRRVPPSVQLAWALLLVVVLDPLAVLSAGFWLSFGAVAALLYAMSGRTGTPGWWWRWGRAQLVVALGLLPVTLVIFLAHPLGGVAANLLAVPWVGMVTVPLTLAGTAALAAWPALGDLVLGAAAGSITLLWPYLSLVAEAEPLLAARGAPGAAAAGLAAAGVVLLLAPRGLPGRWLGALCCLPLLVNAPARPAPGALRLTVLDVGQGLAAVVETARHVLVYDTGPRWSERADAGGSVLVPFLRGSGRRAVDRVVLSHADLDHAGGWRTLRDALVLRAVTTNASDVAPGAAPCEAGGEWTWDGVAFTIVHPAPGERWGRNDGSCAVLVRGPGGSILLPGDVEAPAERALVERRAGALDVDVLVVPHHGSATSSTPELLAATRPEVAVVSTGYRNRYRLPAPAVLARLRAAGAEVVRTDVGGAVTVRLDPGAPPRVETHRRSHRRYWHNVAGP